MGVTGVKSENRYWSVMTAPEGSNEPGINGGIVVRKSSMPKGGESVSALVCTIHVPSVDEYLKKVESAGGTIAIPKIAAPCKYIFS
jgi:predicted enzyme related to lactoylglutathione lyase